MNRSSLSSLKTIDSGISDEEWDARMYGDSQPYHEYTMPKLSEHRRTNPGRQAWHEGMEKEIYSPSPPIPIRHTSIQHTTPSTSKSSTTGMIPTASGKVTNDATPKPSPIDLCSEMDDSIAANLPYPTISFQEKFDAVARDQNFVLLKKVASTIETLSKKIDLVLDINSNPSCTSSENFPETSDPSVVPTNPESIPQDLSELIWENTTASCKNFSLSPYSLPEKTNSKSICEAKLRSNSVLSKEVYSPDRMIVARLFKNLGKSLLQDLCAKEGLEPSSKDTKDYTEDEPSQKRCTLQIG